MKLLRYSNLEIFQKQLENGYLSRTHPVDHVHCFCRSLDLIFDSLSPDLEVLSRSRDFERVLERDFDLRCLVRRSISLKRCSVCRILRSIDLL